MDEMPILTRRRIEAEFARGVYEEMARAFGAEAARRVLAAAVVRMAKAQAADMAREAPGGVPDLASFRAIQRLWTAEDALEIEVLAESATAFDFNVTRCRYAEMYRALGLADLGAVLSCARDGAFCEGYDPKLTLTRTQTIMGGAAHCDFRYRREG